MIYKFIDTNGSEISVNSLSSLQALVDSKTIKEDTKVKAGLRGKWTTASSIEELTFPQEAAEEEEKVAPEVDIKSFITTDENNEELPSEIKPEEVSRMWNDVQNNMMKFQQLFGKGKFQIVDNNGGLGDPERKKNFEKVQKNVTAFLSRPPSNPYAKKWIENERRNKTAINQQEK